MRKVSARLLAWEVLHSVEAEGAYSNLLLPRRLKESALEPRDRAFATELVYGSLRQRSLCDAFIAAVSDRPIEKIDLKLMIALRLGAYQIKVLDQPVHAAINESVELAKTVAGKSASSFANAVLRRIAESDLEFSDLATRYSHPDWIISAFRDALKDEENLTAQLTADNLPAAPTLIAWPDRCEVAELVEAGATAIESSARAASYSGNPGEIAAIRERRAGVQDLGSQLVVENFFATFDSSVHRTLDLCAGPGGKAAYLDSLITSGDFIANEISRERSALVEQVLVRGKVINEDGRALPSELGKFERILVDAPCTGIGALRRRPEVRWRREPSEIRSLVALQAELLDSAAQHLSVGGVIGYATCSPHLAETKFQVRDFLRRHPDFERVPVALKGDKDGDMQLWTYRDNTDAMFLSLLSKKS